MMRLISLGLAAVGLAIVPFATAIAGDAKTTRIEPRPYYGAVVTIESGVRVFRPLPPTKHMIINPGHRTKLSVSQTDVNVRATSRNYFYGVPGSDRSGRASGRYGILPFLPAQARRGVRGGGRFARGGRRFGRGAGRPGRGGARVGGAD